MCVCVKCQEILSNHFVIIILLNGGMCEQCFLLLLCCCCFTIAMSDRTEKNTVMYCLFRPDFTLPQIRLKVVI